MTIITNRWTPDTCSCVLTYTWDNTVPAASRVHTFQSVVSACSFHSGMSGLNQYNAILDENQRKNIAAQTAINAVPAKLSATGVSGGSLVSGSSYHYGWTGVAPNRILYIGFSGVAPNAVQQIAIQSGLTAVAPTKAFMVANLAGVSGITVVA